MIGMHVHASKPIADGILFDDLHGMSIEQCNMLANRGVVFLTEFKAGGHKYGGKIVATCMAAAEDIAFGRGLGEEIIGVLGAVIPCEDM